jgi:hypothetical protein
MRTVRRFGCIVVAMLSVAVAFSCADYSGSVGGEAATPAAPPASTLPAPPTGKSAADPSALLGTWKGDWLWIPQWTVSRSVVLAVEKINGETADVSYSSDEICGGSASGRARIIFRDNMVGLVVDTRTGPKTFFLFGENRLHGTTNVDYGKHVFPAVADLEKSK